MAYVPSVGGSLAVLCSSERKGRGSTLGQLCAIDQTTLAAAALAAAAAAAALAAAALAAVVLSGHRFHGAGAGAVGAERPQWNRR